MAPSKVRAGQVVEQHFEFRLKQMAHFWRSHRKSSCLCSSTRSRQRYKRSFSATAKSVPNSASMAVVSTTAMYTKLARRIQQAGSPPASCNTFSQATSSRVPARRASPKTHAIPVAATTRTPTSSYRTDEGTAVRGRSVHLQTVDGIGGISRRRETNSSSHTLAAVHSNTDNVLRHATCCLIVDLAEIQNGSLHRLVGSDAMIFYNAEVAVIFTVFYAMDAAQKHADGSVPEIHGQRKTVGLHSTVFSELHDGNT